MRAESFEQWLVNVYRTTNGVHMDSLARSSRLSNCKRLEKFEGDLDQHFSRDRCQCLLERLRYSRADERAAPPARHNVQIDGNIREGTATYRSSLNLYIRFCEHSAGTDHH
jgi:hypothetical protein